MARSVADGRTDDRTSARRSCITLPGYPILISPAFLIGDRPFLVLAWMQWGFAVLFMLGVYHWARRWFPTGALWITALVMVNVGFWLLARLTLSEMAFMAALMGNVNAVDRLERRHLATRDPRLDAGDRAGSDGAEPDQAGWRADRCRLWLRSAADRLERADHLEPGDRHDDCDWPSGDDRGDGFSDVRNPHRQGLRRLPLR